MKNRFFTLIFLFITISQVSVKAQVLNTPEIIQEQSEWCWAATSKCILDYYAQGSTQSQCNIANYARLVITWRNFGSVHCCTDPGKGCNYWNYNWGYAGSIEDILKSYGNIKTTNMSTSLTMTALTSEIKKGKPFIFRWGWAGGGGHFMVGHGISGNSMYYMNPLPGYGYEIADYAWVKSAPNVHTWTHTQTVCKPVNPTIVGDTLVCANSTIIYKVKSLIKPDSCTWNLPFSWQGKSSADSIIVKSGATGGNISVSSTFSCGISATKELSLVINSIENPKKIGGDTIVCADAKKIYKVEPVAKASSYKWTLPNGWTGSSNSDTIEVISGNAGGSISVAAEYKCGISKTKVIPVIVNSIDTSVTAEKTKLTSNAIADGYQWVICPEMKEIIGETNKTFSPLQDGTYAVLLEQKGCMSVSNCYTITLPKTGVNPINPSKNISIYPNPTQGLFTLKYNGQMSNTFSFELISSVGQTLDANEFITRNTATETNFDTHSLAAGIYFLKITSDKVMEVFKIQKL